MKVKRLDLGADVVYVAGKDLLVIHPDLDYAEAIGAVAGTLPHLHIDAVTHLVDQVTARPKKGKPAILRAVPIAARMALASVVTLLLVLQLNGGSATAGATFGKQFERQMVHLGLKCSGEGSTRTCFEPDGGMTEIRGYDREDASLYVMVSEVGRSYLLIFDTRKAAVRWQRRHPDVAMTGRAAVW